MSYRTTKIPGTKPPLKPTPTDHLKVALFLVAVCAFPWFLFWILSR